MTDNKDIKKEITQSSEDCKDSIEEELEELDIEVKEEPLLIEYFSKEELLEKIKTLEEEIDKKQKIIDDSKDWHKKFMLLQAEFENSQKRWNKDRQNIRTEYTALTLKKFLPLYDSYKKALENEPENEGLKQFNSQFLGILKSHVGVDVMKVKINDPFDYSYHEALTTLEREDLPNNSIIDIIQDGWMIGKKVLRYAKVITSKKPKPPEPKPKPEAKSEPREDKDSLKSEKIEEIGSKSKKKSK